jgi:hypothetical protein
MNAYYDNVYPKALSHFSTLIPLRSNVIGQKEYLRKVEEVCHHIASEWKEERGLRDARKAFSLADRIRKCYVELRRSL